MQNHYDIAIVGGGIVGMALACALAKKTENAAHSPPLRIVILEARSFISSLPEHKIDSRVSAITRATEYIFKAIGAWSYIPPHRITPYREILVWEDKASSEIHFDSAEIAEANLGYIVENHALQQALHHVLTHLNKDQDFSSVEMICPATLKAIDAKENAYFLHLDNGNSISANLVVGADGASSLLRDLAGISKQSWNYNQSALITTVQCELLHKHAAHQRFLTTGPLAFLPLSEPHTCSIVWSTTPEEANRLQALDMELFCQELGAAFDFTLGAIKQASERIVFPLRMQHVNHYVLPHLALVGDAAHTLHPLAGQGVNLGLLDAACLADVILEARLKKREIGSMATLRRYERWRKGHNLGMIGAMEGFKQLFSNDNSLLKGLRTSGLSLTNRIQPLKNNLMRQAMGLTGELPSLARKWV